MSALHEALAQNAANIQSALDRAVSPAALSGPGTPSDRLVAAMRHGALNGGKRLRPFLLRHTAALFGMPLEQSLPAALALEYVHCYSLIHDDLPAMDDDDLRRGQPTVHKAFDEAAAILAGDALLTHAFAILAAPETHPSAEIRNALVAELAMASGAGGMVGGQMRDLEGERGQYGETDIAQMQDMKTGALIRAACRMGGLLGGADDRALGALTRYGELAGRAFQLADDLLDVTATEADLGKKAGKDADRNKATLVGRLGTDAATRRLGELIHDAITALQHFGPEADMLRMTARYFAERTN